MWIMIKYNKGWPLQSLLHTLSPLSSHGLYFWRSLSHARIYKLTLACHDYNYDHHFLNGKQSFAMYKIQAQLYLRSIFEVSCWHAKQAMEAADAIGSIAMRVQWKWSIQYDYFANILQLFFELTVTSSFMYLQLSQKWQISMEIFPLRWPLLLGRHALSHWRII